MTMRISTPKTMSDSIKMSDFSADVFNQTGLQEKADVTSMINA